MNQTQFREFVAALAKQATGCCPIACFRGDTPTDGAVPADLDLLPLHKGQQANGVVIVMLMNPKDPANRKGVRTYIFVSYPNETTLTFAVVLMLASTLETLLLGSSIDEGFDHVLQELTGTHPPQPDEPEVSVNVGVLFDRLVKQNLIAQDAHQGWFKTEDIIEMLAQRTNGKGYVFAFSEKGVREGKEQFRTYIVPIVNCFLRFAKFETQRKNWLLACCAAIAKRIMRFVKRRTKA